MNAAAAGALALLGGCLHGSGYLPGGAAWTSWVAFVPLLWAMGRRNATWAFWLALVFGSSAWMTALFWMGGPIRDFLGLGAPAAAALYLAVWCYHGLMFSAAAWLAVRVGRAAARRFGLAHETGVALAFVPALAAAEGFYPTIFPGCVAYSQHAWLAGRQSLDLFGTAGVAWLVYGFNAALYAALRARKDERRDPAARRALAVFVLLAAANEGYGLVRLRQVEARARAAAARPLRVGFVQGAIAGAARGEDALRAQGRLTSEILKRSKVDLVVWPESTFGYTIEYDRAAKEPRPTVDGRPLEDFLKDDIPYPVAMLFNTRGRDRSAPSSKGGPEEGYNIAFLSGPGKEFLGVSEKTELFPFGEFIPLGNLFPGFYSASPRSYRLSRGATVQPLGPEGGMRLGALMCYEDLKPRTARVQARKGANLLVSLVEGSWFKGTGGEQHLQFSTARAIENRRALLRVANYGVSAVVDPAGRVTARLPSGEPASMVAAVPLMEGRTLANVLGRALYYLAAAALAALAWLSRPLA
ncbi:MAG TPA: apolipoprotein N-acyltransferase [Elusimicrobiota bacterium]|nr:apolipoprotein N-acyltransferase [Elusimicrobiota bacterium]